MMDTQQDNKFKRTIAVLKSLPVTLILNYHSRQSLEYVCS